MIRRPPRSTPFPTRRSSDLTGCASSTSGSTRTARSWWGPESRVSSAQTAPASRRCSRRSPGRSTATRRREATRDRKSTRLNSSHGYISYAVFCLKKKTRAERRVYKHRDMQDLEKQLQNTERYRRVLIITDGVFSMDGDIAQLPDIVKLAKENGAVVYVDDAHGDGVLGEKGRGITSHFKLHGQVDIEMGTFSKAFGVVGGYVVGSKELCQYLQNKVRSYLLSGSHPPAVVGASIAALKLVEKQPARVKRLWENTHYFKKGLRDLGFDTGQSETPITPVMVGNSRLARTLADAMFDLKVFVLPIVYPMVAKDRARIRTIVTSAHSKRDLDFALDAFDKAGKKLGVL